MKEEQEGNGGIGRMDKEELDWKGFLGEKMEKDGTRNE